MAQPKAKNLRQESSSQLQDLSRTKRQTLARSRFLSAGGKLKNVKEIRSLRRNIAQILTVLHERSFTRRVDQQQ